MFDPTNYTSDGTILEVTFGKGPDTTKYMKYIKPDMLHKTYTVKVTDNRIYKPKQNDKHPVSILATRMVSEHGSSLCCLDNKSFIEVIYPRDLIKTVNK